MKPVEISSATPRQLDWLVATVEGRKPTLYKGVIRASAHPDSQNSAPMFGPELQYTTDPAQMHTITEREKIDRVWQAGGRGDVWTAYLGDQDEYAQDGETSLIASARCFLTFKIGPIAEVPEGLE